VVAKRHRGCRGDPAEGQGFGDGRAGDGRGAVETKLGDREHVSKLIIMLAVAAFYLNILFTAWASFEELQRMSLAFLVSSYFIGMLLSLVPFKRRYLDTFQVTFPAPLICFIFNISVDLAIKSAAAGLTKVQIDGGSVIAALSIALAFLTVFSVLFGLFAILGCYCGYELRVFLQKALASKTVRHHSPEEAAIHGARLAAAATIAAGVIGCVGAVAAAII
jgi:hypothetical protein